MTKDTWTKHRSHGNHLSDDEVQQIRQGYRAGRKPIDIARALKCATRTVNKYYGIFRGDGDVAARPEVQQTEAPSKPGPVDRFYRGSFEL